MSSQPSTPFRKNLIRGVRFRHFTIPFFLLAFVVVSSAQRPLLSIHSNDQPVQPQVSFIITSSGSAIPLGQSTKLSVNSAGEDIVTGKWTVLGGISNGFISTDGTFTSPTLMPTVNPVTVTYTYQKATARALLLLQNPAPLLLSAAPSTISQLKQTVVFSGAGFLPGVSVTVNNVTAETRYLDPTHLSVSITIPQGVTRVISIVAWNPAPTPSGSKPLNLPVTYTPFGVTPSTLKSGTVTISITSPAVTAASVIIMNGTELTTTAISGPTLTASGYLAPWKTGFAAIGLAPQRGQVPRTITQIPIAQTAISYDSASRFATQAAFGPRHDVIEHIQQVGFEVFLGEQMAAPPLDYAPHPCCGPRWVYLNNATSGKSLLRARVSIALQSFIATQGISVQQTLAPWQHKLEVDAFGNFRQVMEDAATDTSMGLFLNLVDNRASSDPNYHPNQNFARELMQLFTLGDVLLSDDGSVQTDSTGRPVPTYDQTTILNLSKVFTGWTCDQTPDPVYTPFGCDYALPLAANEYFHDHTQKTLFGNVLLQAGQDAATDREMALNIIFAHPNLPPFVSRILIQRLVKSNPSPSYIKRISNVFKNDGTGVRGNMAAIVKAILLDPEARIGDREPTPDAGFLQEPLLWETFGMNLLGMTTIDGQPTYVPAELGQNYDYPATVFGFYSPNYQIPGTSIFSPEFQLMNNLSIIQRSQLWWGMVQGSVSGFTPNPTYLYNSFTNIPDLLDALNHLLYHGQMPDAERTAILNYCNSMSSASLRDQFDAAIFLAGNADSYNVSQ